MQESAQWFVYMIQAENGKLYTGMTNHLAKRFKAHQSSIKGARFFNFSKPSKILYYETHTDRSHACKREIRIKKMSRSEKLILIDAFASKLA